MAIPENKRVVVAMSGGVDSSVAAALLKQQGYEVIGMMLRLWSEPGKDQANRCCTPDAMALARRICAQLSIPFYAVDARAYFHDQVVTSFIESYTNGDTPNPCLVCNRHVRWEYLLNHALALGAQYMATGHYARLGLRPDGKVTLLHAVDTAKDQSYVLHVLGQAQLEHALFPLGEYVKPQVRELARQFALPVAERPESQDLCFLGDGDYRSFLKRNAPQIGKPGPILTRDGRQLGQHEGLANYTIGQRKGLGVASLTPLYVLEKDTRLNALIVGEKVELGKRSLVTGPVNWVSGDGLNGPTHLQVKIRYKAAVAWGMVYSSEDGCVRVEFDEPLRDITPGQAAVFYHGETCLGGGLIRLAE